MAWLDLSLLFATDKWMFTHIYKKPPQYDGALARMAAAVLPFAAGIHLGARVLAAASQFSLPPLYTI
eukprot:COSAG05_NODE_1321_length_5191_cov_74.598586_4_plen_67_part_00